MYLKLMKCVYIGLSLPFCIWRKLNQWTRGSQYWRNHLVDQMLQYTSPEIQKHLKYFINFMLKLVKNCKSL